MTVEMEMDGADVTSVVFHRSIVRSDRRLTYTEVDELFAGRARAEEPWGEPLALAREVAAALRERRDALEFGSFEPTFEFDSDGHVTGVRYEAQTESHSLIEMLMILANEQVAGYLADRRLPTLYRVHERPEPQSVVFLADQLASLDIPTPPLPKQMTPAAGGRRGHRDLADRGARVARPAGRSGCSCCARSSRRTTRRATSGTPAWRARATATSPRRSGATPTSWRTARCSRASGIDEAATPAHELDEAGVACSVDRARGDEDRARRRRRLPHVPARARAVGVAAATIRRPSRARWSGLIEKGAFVQFGEERFEGFLPVRRLRGWWTLNEVGTALEAEELGPPAAARRRARRCAVDRVDAPRGRVDLEPAEAYS